jgi:hypothetical protein
MEIDFSKVFCDRGLFYFAFQQKYTEALGTRLTSVSRETASSPSGERRDCRQYTTQIPIGRNGCACQSNLTCNNLICYKKFPDLNVDFFDRFNWNQHSKSKNWAYFVSWCYRLLTVYNYMFVIGRLWQSCFWRTNYKHWSRVLIRSR